jgi:hypothetical protein
VQRLVDIAAMQALTRPKRWHAGPGWSGPVRRRAWAVLLAVAIALASFMHVAHTHEAEVPASYKFCSFCASFDRGGGAPPPVIRATVVPVFPDAPAIVVDATVPQVRLVRPSCHPRAPPVLQA